MTSTSKRINRHFAILLVLSALVFTANIGGYSIYVLDEAKNSECAREMLESGNLIVPTFNYELRTDKPPLHYYFMMLGYKIFGVNEFAPRFFSTICGILTVLATYFFTRKYLCEDVAFYSALTLLSSLQLIIQFHLAVPDPYLIFFITLALHSFFAGYSSGKVKYYYLFYTSLALATLAKGPVALALPGLIILFFIIFKKDFTWKKIMSFRPFSGALLYLLIALPWYVAVTIATNWAWTEGFFLKHNISRFSAEMEGHGGPFFMPFVFVITGLLPFSQYIFQALGRAWNKRKSNDLILFSLIVLSIFVVFFGISRTKLPSYPAPCFPFAAILIGYFMHKLEVSGHIRKKLSIISLIFYTLITIAIPVAIYIALQHESYFAHLTHLSFYFLALPIGAVIACIFAYQRKIRTMFFVFSASFIITSLLFSYVVFPQVDEVNPVRLALPKIDVERPIVHYRNMNAAFPFYLKKPIPKLKTEEEVTKFIQQEGKVYVISTVDHKEELEKMGDFKLIHQHRDLFEPTTTIILERM
ncbi:glycosyltransferase family 39 protein [Flammeovirgaceae bacterium SG7u.111]|nr:glycosyltransferase family 39 protein [Flammeovirgaceae bacterium SG7u.132]WPO36094.1 glycosyltransferase family 39 protein [Flammeovirgaceae bacterium SG7u.111]